MEEARSVEYRRFRFCLGFARIGNDCERKSFSFSESENSKTRG